MRWRPTCCLTLALVIASIGRLWAVGPVSELDVLRAGEEAGQAPGDGFVRALQPREFVFPRDHGPHPEFRHEWWYVTGNLDSATGERFGFELTFFRVGLVPPVGAGPGGGAPAVAAAGDGSLAVGASAPGAREPVSRWRTRQVYMAHFAITDVSRGEFRFAQKYSRDALGLAGAQAEPLHVWLGDWSLGAAGVVSADGAVGPAAAGAAGNANLRVGDVQPDWTLHAEGEGYELKLEAQALMAPMLNGDRGLSRKSGEPGAASYYYSIPRVAVRGTVVRAGQRVDVGGLAWLDREWGSGSLGQHQQGWDWFALQQQDGSALMFYALRAQDGGRDPHSAGTWVDSAGRVRALSSDDVHIDVTDHWGSPRGGRYPSRWRIRIPAVGLDVEVRPALANQELGTRPRYWEGAVDVSGAGDSRKASGRGYVELVGYGE